MSTTDIATSNSLPDLAARIRTEHRAAKLAARKTLEHAIQAGDCCLRRSASSATAIGATGWSTTAKCPSARRRGICDWHAIGPLLSQIRRRLRI
jgi:hypothetical protein